MFTALGYGYNLFSFKHGPINITLSSKMYGNTSLYFIYLCFFSTVLYYVCVYLFPLAN